MASIPRNEKAPWYVRAFNADYLTRYKHRSDELAQTELPFVVQSLNAADGATILDLCCGAGRHARGLAAALKNGQVVGLDLSADLLTEARSKRSGFPRLFYVRADMRRIPLKTESVDGVVNLFTSFGYFKTEREHLSVLKEIARVLKPGGRFVMDFLNRDAVIARLVKRSESEVNGSRIVETRRYDARSKRIVKTIRIFKPDGSGDVRGEEMLRESIRAYGPDELKAMLIQAGLTPLSLHGDLKGIAFGAESQRCVWVCEKRGEGRTSFGLP